MPRAPLGGGYPGPPAPRGPRGLPPTMRARPQPPGLACGRAALAPGAVAASAPHPTTLNAVVTFSYAAAYSACRSHSAFSIPPCGRVPSPHPTTLKAVADGLPRAHPNGRARINPSALFCPSTTAGSRTRQLPTTALIWLAMCVALERSKAVADGLPRAHPNGRARINPSALICPLRGCHSYRIVTLVRVLLLGYD